MPRIDDYIYDRTREIQSEANDELKHERSKDFESTLQSYLFSDELPDESISELKYEIIKCDRSILEMKKSGDLDLLDKDPIDIKHNVDALKNEYQKLCGLIQAQLDKLEQWYNITAAPTLDLEFDANDLKALNEQVLAFLKAIDDNNQKRLQNEQKAKERKKRERIAQLELEKQRRLDELRRRMEKDIDSTIERDRLKLQNERISNFNKRSKKRTTPVKTMDTEFENILKEFIDKHRRELDNYKIEDVRTLIKNDVFLFEITKKDPKSLTLNKCYEIMTLCKEQKALADDFSYYITCDLKVYGDYGRDLKAIFEALKETAARKNGGYTNSTFWWK